MASYILRKLDDDFWRRVKAQAAQEGLSVKAVIVGLLTAWLEPRPRPGSFRLQPHVCIALETAWLEPRPRPGSGNTAPPAGD